MNSQVFPNNYFQNSNFIVGHIAVLNDRMNYRTMKNKSKIIVKHGHYTAVTQKI